MLHEADQAEVEDQVERSRLNPKCLSRESQFWKLSRVTLSLGMQRASEMVGCDLTATRAGGPLSQQCSLKRDSCIRFTGASSSLHEG